MQVPTTVRRAALLALAVLARCTCGTNLSNTPFACQADSDCADGYVCLDNLCAPPGGDVDSGAADAQVSDAGAPDGGSGGDAGQFLLVFSGADSGVAGSCLMGTATVETPSGAPAPVQSPTVVALVASVGLGLFSDAACLNATSSATLASGASSAPFHYGATKAGSYLISGTAVLGGAGVSAAPLAVGIVAGQPGGLYFTVAPRTTVQEGCALAPSTVGILDAYGNATSTPTAFTAGLSVGPTGSEGFYQDANCRVSSNGGLSFGAGASLASFYLLGLQAGTSTVAVDAGLPLGPATQNELVLPNARTGVCQLLADAGTVTCAYAAPGQQNTSRTLYAFQAASNADSPAYANVSCGPVNATQIRCSRAAGAQPPATADIRWETLEHNSLTVQHVATQCSGAGAWTVSLGTAVNPASTFVLKGNAESGTAQTSEDFYDAQLIGATQVAMASSAGACPAGSALNLDVVEVAGASVTRGTAGPMSSTALAVTGLAPINLATTALLFSYRVTVPAGDTASCDRMLEGQLTGTTGLTFTRGFGADAGTDAGTDAGCTRATVDTISWERIDFGAVATVQVVDAVLDAGVAVKDFPLASSVDLTRTLALATGQGVGGQGTGAGSSEAAAVGSMIAGFSFPDGGVLRVSRDSAAGDGHWTVQVIQLH